MCAIGHGLGRVSTLGSLYCEPPCHDWLTHSAYCAGQTTTCWSQNRGGQRRSPCQDQIECSACDLDLVSDNQTATSQAVIALAYHRVFSMCFTEMWWVFPLSWVGHQSGVLGVHAGTCSPCWLPSCSVHIFSDARFSSEVVSCQPDSSARGETSHTYSKAANACSTDPSWASKQA